MKNRITINIYLLFPLLTLFCKHNSDPLNISPSLIFRQEILDFYFLNRDRTVSMPCDTSRKVNFTSVEFDIVNPIEGGFVCRPKFPNCKKVSIMDWENGNISNTLMYNSKKEVIKFGSGSALTSEVQDVFKAGYRENYIKSL